MKQRTIIATIYKSGFTDIDEKVIQGLVALYKQKFETDYDVLKKCVDAYRESLSKYPTDMAKIGLQATEYTLKLYDEAARRRGDE